MLHAAMRKNVAATVKREVEPGSICATIVAASFATILTIARGVTRCSDYCRIFATAIKQLTTCPETGLSLKILKENPGLSSARELIFPSAMTHKISSRLM